MTTKSVNKELGRIISLYKEIIIKTKPKFSTFPLMVILYTSPTKNKLVDKSLYKGRKNPYLGKNNLLDFKLKNREECFRMETSESLQK